ncbi:MAG TPA: hypothetical protein VMZ50_02050, partial [Phycisphaerae bacterium]|nr:hypothetical protein [Phycisphaerae bacterium]
MATRDQLLQSDRNISGLTIPAPVPPKAAERAVVLPDLGLTLRRLNPAETVYDPAGLYLEEIVELPDWRTEDVDALFGFQTCELVDPVIANQADADKATLGYQVSNDGGTSWLVFDTGGGMWVPATGAISGTFMTSLEVDTYLHLLPVADNPRSVRIRVRLSPGASGRQRPVLERYHIFHDTELDLMHDVSISLRRFIEGAVKVPMFFITELGAATGTITIPDSSSNPADQPSEPGFDVTIAEPVEAYNLTVDPKRLSNLFGTLSGRTVTLIAAQPAGDKVEVAFTGLPDVFISAEEFFQLSKIPSIVVSV